ncbi:MAG TPA: Dyp-type peroxidase, partial [Acidimicrobiales bacterium]
PAEAAASFPDDFRAGMRARAARLGETDADLDAWDPGGLHDARAHVLVMVHARAAENADAGLEAARCDAAAHGLEVVHTQVMSALAVTSDAIPAWRRMEHFGFVDGVSQPAVEGALEPTVVEGNGTPVDGGWRAVRAGEFVLGHPDEEEAEPPLPRPDWLVRNGSYLVVRKLAQDVAGFRRLVAEQGRRHDLAPAEVAAKLVGRRADGTPLLPAARADAPRSQSDLNDVRYENDRLGHACPVGSHVRRANPRDALDVSPALVSRHRLLRRGMPYGPPLADGVTTDDGHERGLVFAAYCASIERQFEFVQREWLNDGNVFGAGHAPDPVVGHGDAPRRFVVTGPCPVFLGGLPRLVRPLGGEYLFQPGRRGIRGLADLD